MLDRETAIKIYTPEALRQLEGSNIFSLNFYNDRGVEINFQGTSDSPRHLQAAYIEPHTHPYDEIIFRISGDYGDHNKKDIVENTDSILIIHSGIEHGGNANGFWMSIKPMSYKSKSGSWSIRSNKINTLEYVDADTNATLTIASGKDWYARFVNDLKPDFLAMAEVVGGRCPRVTVFDVTQSIDYDQLYGEKFLALKFGEIPAEFYRMHDKRDIGNNPEP